MFFKCFCLHIYTQYTFVGFFLVCMYLAGAFAPCTALLADPKLSESTALDIGVCDKAYLVRKSTIR